MEKLPLYFSRTYSLESRLPGAGSDMLVRVGIEGRCVFVDDESGQLGARYWYNGVNPGGVAGSGDTRQEAERDFFDAIGLTLQELTSESGSQEEFRDLVKAFVEDVNRPELQDWLKLRQEVRAGAVSASDLAPEKADKMPRSVVEVFTRKSDPGEPELESTLPHLEIASRTEIKLAACG